MTHRFTSLETETKNPAMNYFLLYNSGTFVVDTLPKKITLADFDKKIDKRYRLCFGEKNFCQPHFENFQGPVHFYGLFRQGLKA